MRHPSKIIPRSASLIENPLRTYLHPPVFVARDYVPILRRPVHRGNRNILLAACLSRSTASHNHNLDTFRSQSEIPCRQTDVPLGTAYRREFGNRSFSMEPFGVATSTACGRISAHASRARPFPFSFGTTCSGPSPLDGPLFSLWSFHLADYFSLQSTAFILCVQDFSVKSHKPQTVTLPCVWLECGVQSAWAAKR